MADKDLTVYTENLPATLEDLSKFILVGREKLIAVRAEIRAIDRLGLAQQVRDQKVEECRMLAEALLDAEVKVGELLKQTPSQQGIRLDLTSSHHREEVKTSYDNKIDKPKNEIKKELVVNKNQAYLYEKEIEATFLM